MIFEVKLCCGYNTAVMQRTGFYERRQMKYYWHRLGEEIL